MTFTLTPRGPFDLRMSNQYFGGWTDAHHDPLVVPMAFPIEGWAGSAAVLVRQHGDGKVSGSVHGAPRGHERAAWEQAMAALSLDEDGSGFAEVGRRDPVIGELQARYPGLRPVLFHSPYEAAAAFVIGHRISIAQGRAIRKRLAERHGEAITTPAGVVYAFPTPQRLLKIDSFPGVFAAKWERLHAVAQAAMDGVLDRHRLRALPVEAALRQLREIPGIGPFFSQGVLMRGAGLVDAVPDDHMTTKVVQLALSLPAEPTHAGIVEVSERWRPYGMWCTVLFHVEYRAEAGRKSMRD